MRALALLALAAALLPAAAAGGHGFVVEGTWTLNGIAEPARARIFDDVERLWHVVTREGVFGCDEGFASWGPEPVVLVPVLPGGCDGGEADLAWWAGAGAEARGVFVPDA